MPAFENHTYDHRHVETEQRLSPALEELADHGVILASVTPFEFTRHQTTQHFPPTITPVAMTHLTAEDENAFLLACNDKRPTQALIDIFALHAQVANSSKHD